MKKLPLILLTMILIMCCLVACGGEKEPVETTPPEQVPTEPVYDPNVDKEKVVTAFNDFFFGQISLKSFFNQRAIVTDVDVEDLIDRKNSEKIDPNIQEILWSNNMAYIKYGKSHYVNDFAVNSEYFVIQDEGYYLIKTDGTNYRYSFKPIKIPNFESDGLPHLSSQHVIWADSSKVFRIDPAFLKMFAEELLIETKLLSNFSNRTYNNEEIEQLIEDCNMTAYVKIDETSGKLTEFNLTSALTQNGINKNILNIILTVNDGKITFDIKYSLANQKNISGTITKESENNYIIRTTITDFNLIGVRSKDTQYTFRISVLNEDPINLQNNIEEMMLKCDRLISQYNSVVSDYDKEFDKPYGCVCDSIYIYDERYRVYIRLIPNENNKFIFDGIVLDCNEDVEGMATIKDKKLSMIHHSENEQWLNTIAAKYSDTYTCVGCSENNCINVYIFDQEYKRYIIFGRTANGYKYVENKEKLESESSFLCTGTIDLNSKSITLEDHSDFEVFFEKISSNTIAITNRKSGCSQLYITEYGINFVFTINENGRAEFIGITNYTPSCCSGYYNVSKNSINIGSHANHD